MKGKRREKKLPVLDEGIYIPIDERDEDADREMERRYERMGGGA